MRGCSCSPAYITSRDNDNVVVPLIGAVPDHRRTVAGRITVANRYAFLSRRVAIAKGDTIFGTSCTLSHSHTIAAAGGRAIAYCNHRVVVGRNDYTIANCDCVSPSRLNYNTIANGNNRTSS